VATGSGRTLEAIRRMVPAHAAMMDGYRGWTVTAAHAALPAPDMGGVVLTVSAPSQAYPAEIAHIQGLGFFGFMASGAHHQVHHLAIAKGEHIHGDH
jgi:hypothetical protein